MFRKSHKSNDKKRSLVVRDQPRSPISEQFRTIRTNIQFSSVDENMQVIMTTSSGPTEGKTTVNSNLAVTMGQQGGNVLLIDADMRKPSVHYTFRLPNHVGLTNVITKQRELQDVTHSTDIEGLDVLTCGPLPPNPSELLGSQKMKDFLMEARQEYDHIVIDTPPVLAVTDAQIVAGLSDGVVLVVDSGHTEKEDARKATELLNHTNAKMLGAVLNSQERKASNYMYYYG
ncbi:capsular exopolysaccharide synthesis family protein [Geomicrobium halophilum]|uniref:non-specific protein-tyrosine kinase n=1 Tax=Geomicrobium halophilum TaxID=549000 RepID=A0A841PZ77_9BACL|nr:CpsD/CapB family tyrosine-protein kinase [Geomicrobium halophilum]MBB6449882.1 capsular exopolysaccharide synthesis family protein [Geomicrobium halophilum]